MALALTILNLFLHFMVISQRFTSNRGEWEAFGWFVRNIMAGVIFSLSGYRVADSPRRLDAEDGLEDLLE